MLLWGTAHSRSSLHIGRVCSVTALFFFFSFAFVLRSWFCPRDTQTWGYEGKISLKTFFKNFTGYVGLASSTSFTLVNQWQYPESPVGFCQTIHYKSSPLRKFFVILTFRYGDKRAHCKYCNLAFLHCLFKIFIFHVCCQSLDSVVLHSDFCLASFLLFKSFLSMDSFSLQVWINSMIYPVAVGYHRFSFLSPYNSGFMSQARRTWHFSHASHSFRTSRKTPSSPRLAHKAPVMQAIHFFVCMLSFLTNITFYYLNQFNRAIRLVSINMTF